MNPDIIKNPEEKPTTVSRAQWRRALRKMEKLPPPVIERRPACNHELIKKIIPDELVYECQGCKEIIQIVGAAMYRPEIFVRNMSIISRYIGEAEPVLKEMAKEIITMEVPEEDFNREVLNETPTKD